MFLVKGTITFELETEEAASDAEAREIANSIELRVAPRFAIYSHFLDENIDIDEVEETDE